MKAQRPFETSITIYRSTERNITEEWTLCTPLEVKDETRVTSVQLLHIQL